jgi:hypothetical protein
VQRRDLPKALLAAAAVPTPGSPPDGSLTDAERKAGVTRVNYAYAQGDVRRYGAVGDGVASDDDAVQAALNVGSKGGSPIVFPAGGTFRITRYLSIGSDTVVFLYGTLQLTNRASGLYSNGGANIGIFGFKVGKITDATVAAGYVWNRANGVTAPAIHLRSVTNATVEGVNFTHLSQGCLISGAVQNSVEHAAFSLTQAAPTHVTVRDCSMTFCELAGLACYSGQYCTYENNYVYRCGDGGMWMMGALNSQIINNQRVSPYASPAEVAAHGQNNPSHPSTWNDEQGIELEACRDLLVSGNVVIGFQAFGIDVKNTCNRVVVRGNRVSDCENASIIVRNGETPNACHKISIVANTISGHGRAHYGVPFPLLGAIRVGECYISEIIDNLIYAYRNTVGISCVGPGSYLTRQYGGNPHQASVVVRGNSVDFKNSFQTNEEEFQYSAGTLSAILVKGVYDIVQIVDNKISADCYINSDARINTTPAIALTYERAGDLYFPSNAKLDGNTIGGWGGAGIAVHGLTGVRASGLSVCHNSIGPVGSTAISVTAANYCNVSGNTVAQVNGRGAAGIAVAGSAGNLLAGALVAHNSISGAWQTGGNGLTYGIALRYCADSNVSNNLVAMPTSGSFDISDCTGIQK